MAERGEGMVATGATLSHSHMNCAMRNILCSKKRCECSQDRKKCQCPSAPLLDDNGNYCLTKVQSHDKEWARACHSGLEWEKLSWKMDVEEPDAALIISIALNKKNEAAMKTGRLEIMKTLVALCEPTPDGVVHFDPVRDQLIELYGTAVDHPDFVNAFRLVMVAGGSSSMHMQDLQDFTTVYVNPKLRKMRMEAYTVVAPYPIDFPKIKNACLKWAWKQSPKQGWCQLPPNIAHRFTKESKYNMQDFMMEVELAMTSLNKWVSTVVETLGEKKDLKAKTKWIAEVEINIMSKIFAGPTKSSEGETFPQKTTELRKQCAAFIATKLLDLLKL